MNQVEFEKRLREKYPDEHYKIIYAGTRNKDNSVIKCLDCGRRITTNTGELFRNRRKHICSKCHYKRRDTAANEEIIRTRLKEKASNINFFMQDRKGIRHNMVSFTCNNCGHINTKEIANFLKQKYDCVYCEGNKTGKDTDIFLRELYEKYGNKFSLLAEYIDVKTPIRVKCNKCGFIRDIKPPVLLRSGYCPKCDKKDSIGEKKIVKYLEQNNIKYISQMYFSNWNIGIHYFDFYIPQYNLILEYHGIQHYEYNKYFHKDFNEFQYRQKKDIEKKETALKNDFNYISIKYTLINNLDSILEYIFNSTTIPDGSRGKCLEIETIQDIG